MTTSSEIRSAMGALEKAIQGSDPDAILSSLKALHRLPVNRDVLSETRVGVLVNKVRKLEWIGRDAADEAHRVLSSWKSLLLELSTAKQKKGDDGLYQPSEGSDISSRKRSSASVASKDSKKSREGEGTPSEGVDIRQKCIQMLIEALMADFSQDCGADDNMRACATEIEGALFEEFAGRTDVAYKTKFRAKYLNLKRNADLRSNLLSGDLTPTAFVSMTAGEMASEEQRQRDLVLQRQNLLNALHAKDTQAETDQFKCSKCKQRRCKYYQLQTRSADEPMTTFVTCVNCGNRWKFC